MAPARSTPSRCFARALRSTSASRRSLLAPTGCRASEHRPAVSRFTPLRARVDREREHHDHDDDDDHADHRRGAAYPARRVYAGESGTTLHAGVSSPFSTRLSRWRHSSVKSIPRVDGAAKVQGTAAYVDDLIMPGALHGATVRSEIARGRLRGSFATRPSTGRA